MKALKPAARILGCLLFLAAASARAYGYNKFLDYSKLDPRRDYLVVSENPHGIRFFKTPDFSGAPAMELNNTGFLTNSLPICYWDKNAYNTIHGYPWMDECGRPLPFILTTTGKYLRQALIPLSSPMGQLPAQAYFEGQSYYVDVAKEAVSGWIESTQRRDQQIKKYLKDPELKEILASFEQSLKRGKPLSTVYLSTSVFVTYYSTCGDDDEFKNRFYSAAEFNELLKCDSKLWEIILSCLLKRSYPAANWIEPSEQPALRSRYGMGQDLLLEFYSQNAKLYLRKTEQGWKLSHYIQDIQDDD